MLFNSIEYLVYFLPPVLLGYYAIGSMTGGRYLMAYLAIVSVLFYAIASPRSLPVLLFSIVLNYVLAAVIQSGRNQAAGPWLLGFGIVANLGCLAWFKYLNFGLSTLNSAFGLHLEMAAVFLPLGISFYTFKQVAYLIDVYRGDIESQGPMSHTLAVLFFPQLIAGPIVLHRDFCRQTTETRLGRYAASNLVVGMSIFAVGLFKRTVIADSATVYCDPVFDNLADSDHVSFLSAWTAALCYTLQLYFDFSGYSDMAVGSARMFGLKLPINFFSPLKARSIIEYWRRWHMTLQQIIVRYVFQPILLPLSRMAAQMGLSRWPSFWFVTVLPALFTFCLVGLWHGAGWTFVLFGLIHGIYVAINEAWRLLTRKQRKQKRHGGMIVVAISHALTLTCIWFANVLFRADSIGDATRIWSGMWRLSELATLFQSRTLAELLFGPLPVIVFGYAIVFMLPNTHQFFHRFASVIDRSNWASVEDPIVDLRWRPTLAWAAAHGIVLCLGIAFTLRVQTKFIYFNF